MAVLPLTRKDLSWKFNCWGYQCESQEIIIILDGHYLEVDFIVFDSDDFQVNALYNYSLIVHESLFLNF
jgi:hypothetical protein